MPRKKDKMAETVKRGEQLPLIDVGPKKAKELAQLGREYKKVQRARQALLQKEVALKEKILSLVKAEKLKPLEDGSIRFKVENLEINIKPRDELVQIKLDEDKSE